MPAEAEEYFKKRDLAAGTTRMNKREVAAILDSQGIADGFIEWVRREAKKFPFTPALETVLYLPTADAASRQYRDLILKDAERIGLSAQSLEASNVTELKNRLLHANSDPKIQGIVVLYPLRCNIPDEDVMDLVSPHKDAEGLHSVNLGYLIKFKKFLDPEREIKCVIPATPKAVVKALQCSNVKIEGSFAAVINNSMRVGKPLGLMLENLGATVVKCYHATRPADLEYCVRHADIVVTAVPDPSFHLDPAWIKPGAAVVDVSHQGNIDCGALRGKASLITLPENRIGKVTRAMMFVNLIYCSRYKGIFYD